jgi:hypothetical protein
LHRGASQLSEGVRGDPASRPGVLPPDSLRGANRGAIQARISLADVPQRPVHGFAHEIPFVEGFPFDYA